MKKIFKNHLIALLALILSMGTALTGCGMPVPGGNDVPVSGESSGASSGQEDDALSDSGQSDESMEDAGDSGQPGESFEDERTVTHSYVEEPEAAEPPGQEEPEAAELPADAEARENGALIVWLGDSLTQGSLGAENDNLAGAPYERLAMLCDKNPVEGHGYYAYFTDDIFHTYLESAEKDPDHIYVLWVGSNDFTYRDDGAYEDVMASIDAFLGEDLKKFVVLSTPPRYELREGDVFSKINQALAAHYGEHYVEFTDRIPVPEGFSGDQIHLSQESYDLVADAVYEKLKELKYID
ncbi:MAG: SGNH/GDSL hydrolase family protein [Lachnospiraceae bacterium]|nr:SGNH/GDSL hydrolase family protein [Lachnospiraceae bacterium]